MRERYILYIYRERERKTGKRRGRGYKGLKS